MLEWKRGFHVFMKAEEKSMHHIFPKTQQPNKETTNNIYFKSISKIYEKLPMFIFNFKNKVTQKSSMLYPKLRFTIK